MASFKQGDIDDQKRHKAALQKIIDDPTSTGEEKGSAQGDLQTENRLNPGEWAHRNDVNPDGTTVGQPGGNWTPVNPGSTQVGGHKGGGQEIHDAALAGMHRGDAAYDANQSAMNGSIANMKQDRGVMSPENSTLLGREAATRGQQVDSLGLDRNAAEGNAPSASAFQTRGDMNNIMAGNAGAMGGARGLGALNGGQVLGASTGANAAGGAAFNGGMGRSSEMGTAMGMYGSNANNVRGGDLNRLEQSSKNSMFNSDLNNNWKTSNAALAAKQGELGNEQEKMRGAWYDASTEPAQRQAGYDQTMNGMQHGQNAADASAAVARSRADQDRQRKLAGDAGVAGLTLVGTAFGGPAGGALAGMGGSYINSQVNPPRY